jgi:hypothetical protein
MLFDRTGAPVSIAQREFAQSFPHPGWVEHDANEIWASQRATIAEVLAKARVSIADVHAVGITNQRETTVVWDRASGLPIAPAIVWQDRRTAERCAQLRAAGHEPMIRKQTGLVLDPYFSATKIAWLLDNIPGARSRASLHPLPVCACTARLAEGQRAPLRCGDRERYLAVPRSGGLAGLPGTAFPVLRVHPRHARPVLQAAVSGQAPEEMAGLAMV